MISVDNLTKTYGPQVLFDKVSFKINARERVGLVGLNGHGKTTLLRMIVGEESPDDGLISIPRGYRLGYVRQQIEFTASTVLKEGMLGLSEQEQHQSWKVEKILSGLGFSKDDMQRNPHEFSGGYQIRIKLTKVLVSEPDLLLLDEPTNYLDITSIRWIERFLLDWPHELLLITHDRSFMDKVITHTLGIHRQRLRKIEGNTEKYYAQVAMDEEVYEKTRLNDERKRREIELFITRFRAKARLAGLVQSRVKTLAKHDKKEKIEKIKSLDFAFRYKPYQGKFVGSARSITFGYTPGATIINNFSLTIGARDRIGIVGRNGKGKTTLLRLLAGDLSPAQGDIIWNRGVAYGFFEQTHTARLLPSRTVEEEILSADPDTDRQKARSICGAMLFEGDQALKKIGVLSGGEKSRVLLGKLLATPLNVLMLDEPTNHLDMQSCDALLAALDNFDGAVIMVTHNEMFLHALAERLIVFQNNNVTVFEGGYQDFLDRQGWIDEDVSLFDPDTISVITDESRPSKKDLRRARSAIMNERARVIKPIEMQMNQIEERIMVLERENAAILSDIALATQSHDGRTIARLSRELGCREQEIDHLFGELERLHADIESRRLYFDERLNEIEKLP